MKWREGRKKRKSLSADGKYIHARRLTTCCESTVEMRMVGQELFVVCADCDKYIGNVVIRPIGILETNFEQYLGKAAGERHLDGRFLQGEVDEMFEIYVAKLDKFAQQAARSALREYVPFEEAAKKDDKR